MDPDDRRIHEAAQVTATTAVSEAAQAAATAGVSVVTAVVPEVPAAVIEVPDGNWADDADNVSQNFGDAPQSTLTRPLFVASAADQAFSSRGDARHTTFSLSPSRVRASSPDPPLAPSAASPFLARRVSSRSVAQTRSEPQSQALLRVQQRIRDRAMAEAPEVAPMVDDADVEFSIFEPLQASMRDCYHHNPDQARAYLLGGPRDGT